MVRIPASALQTLLGEQADLDEKLQLIHSLRSGSGAHSLALDRALLRAYAAASNGLKEARQAQAQLSETLEKLTEPPWHVATYLGMVETGFGPRVEVIWDGSRHVVRADDELAFDELRCGDEVYLCDQRNMVMSISRSLPAGETATYDRATADGRLVLRARDEEIIVVPADRLDVAQLCKGDLVRWNRSPCCAKRVPGVASTSTCWTRWPTSWISRPCCARAWLARPGRRLACATSTPTSTPCGPSSSCTGCGTARCRARAGGQRCRPWGSLWTASQRRCLRI